MKNTNLVAYGSYRIEVVNPDGSVDFDSGYKPNVILNQGLDWLLKNDTSGWSIRVGSGTSTPDATQTGLDNFLRGISSGSKSVFTPQEAFTQWRHRGSMTNATIVSNGTAYNVSEIALYDNTFGNYLTRSLILDTDDLPITLSVNETQDLRVGYAIEYWLDTATLIETTPSIDVKGTPTSVGVIWYNVENWSMFNTISDNTSTFNGNIVRDGLDAGNLAALTLSNTWVETDGLSLLSYLAGGVGTVVNSGVSTMGPLSRTVDVSVPNEITLSVSIPADKVPYNISAFLMSFGNNLPPMVLTFDPAMPKASTETLDFSLTFTIVNGPKP